MKTIYKIMISFGIGICFIIAGVAIGGLKDVTSIGFWNGWHWQWNPESVQDLHFNAVSDVDEFVVKVHQGRVEFHVSQDDHIQVKASQIYTGFDIYQNDGKIIIEQPHYWGFNNNKNAQVDVYIPESIALEKIKLEMSAGRTKVYGVKAEKVDIDAAAGVLTVENIECKEFDLDSSMGNTIIRYLTSRDIHVDLGAGNLKMLLNGVESEYNYNVDVGLGNVKIGNEKFSGIADKKTTNSHRPRTMDIDCTMGNVKVEMEDSL